MRFYRGYEVRVGWPDAWATCESLEGARIAAREYLKTSRNPSAARILRKIGLRAGDWYINAEKEVERLEP